MKNYIKALGKIMASGWDEGTKDNGPVRLLLGQQLRFVLAKGFPLLTTREMDFDQVRERAFAVLACSDTAKIIKQIKESPTGPLEIIVTERAQFDTRVESAKALELLEPVVGLAPKTSQIVTEGNYVHFVLNYDSIDYVVDLPQAIAIYALVAKLLIREIGGHYPGELVVNFGRGFIRHEHFAAVNEQINRRTHKLGAIVLNEERATWRDMLGEDGQPNPEDVKLEGYTHWDPIKL